MTASKFLENRLKNLKDSCKFLKGIDSDQQFLIGQLAAYEEIESVISTDSKLRDAKLTEAKNQKWMFAMIGFIVGLLAAIPLVTWVMSLL